MIILLYKSYYYYLFYYKTSTYVNMKKTNKYIPNNIMYDDTIMS